MEQPKITELSDVKLMGAQKHWTAVLIEAQAMVQQISIEVDRRLNQEQNTLLPQD